MKKTETEKVNVVFLLDRSGSMRGSEEDTIGGYNSYISKVKNDNAYITTILFDDKYEELNYQEEVKNIKELSDKEYYVRGRTALYDAIGRTITKIDNDVKNEKVLFIITTDGLENASVEYDRKTIYDMIKKHKNWEFIYLGANIDSYSEGSKIGIKSENISNYSKSKKGIESMFDSMARVTRCVAFEECLNEDWKKDIK